MIRTLIYKCSICGEKFATAINTDKKVIEIPNLYCVKDGNIMNTMSITDEDIFKIEQDKVK